MLDPSISQRGEGMKFVIPKLKKPIRCRLGFHRWSGVYEHAAGGYPHLTVSAMGRPTCQGCGKMGPERYAL